jgi:hypothetical protein
MPKHLTAENLARLQAQAEKLQLWEHARGSHVGPVTVSGKRKSALRGLKHGLAGQGGRAMNRWLASLNVFCGQLNIGA